MEDKEVAEGEEPDAFWTRVGSAWPHKNGKGMNIELSALPLDGRLVLLEYTEKDHKADTEKAAKKMTATLALARSISAQVIRSTDSSLADASR